MFGIKEKIRFNKYQKKWRAKNKGNNTWPQNYFPIECARVGKYTYGALNISSFNDKSKLSIGSFCSIDGDVMFFLDAEHPLNVISTYPFHVDVLKDTKYEATSKGNIIVDDDVWIGYRV